MHSPSLSVGGVSTAKSAIPSAIVPGDWSTSAKFGRSWKGANVSKVMDGCRRSAYLEEEKPYMLSLPASV